MEDPEEDLTCSRPVALEVLAQAWDGLVDQAAAARQVVEVQPGSNGSVSTGIGLMAGASVND